MYPSTAGDGTITYIHCDGEKLQLADSDSGSNTNSLYYRWTGDNKEKDLLFILPMVVSLTTIMLHYYSDSDSDQGLPRLRFYAVPDDFNVWESLQGTNYPHVNVVSVPPGEEPVGRRNVSISVNFDTKKVLMYKYRSGFQLAVSEVEFFNCSCKLAVFIQQPINLLLNVHSNSNNHNNHNRHHYTK